MDTFREQIKQYRFPALSVAVTKAAAEEAMSRESSEGLRLSASGQCARKLAYQTLNRLAKRAGLPEPFEAETLQPRALMVFHLGDMVEASLKAWLAKAQVSFIPLAPPNDRVCIKVDGVEIYGHPDGLFQEPDGSLSLVSIKSSNTRGFDRVERDGPSYEHVCQETAYMAALEIYKARYLYYDKNTSHIGDDWMVEFSPALYSEIVARWRRVIHARPDSLPEREHQAEPETEWVRGLKGYKVGTTDCNAITKDGDGKVVTEVKSNGYHRQTGRSVLPWQCSYCPFKKPCWGESLTMEIDGDSPVWLVKVAA